MNINTKIQNYVINDSGNYREDFLSRNPKFQKLENIVDDRVDHLTKKGLDMDTANFIVCAQIQFHCMGYKFDHIVPNIRFTIENFHDMELLNEANIFTENELYQFLD